MNQLNEPLWRHDATPEPETVWHFRDAAGFDDYALSDADYDALWRLYSAAPTPFTVTPELVTP